MNVVRDRPAAKWLSSRHRFALARLVAFAMLTLHREASDADHLILAVDRDQSALETYTASVWYLAVLILFLAAFVPLLAALPLSLVVVEIPVYVFGLPFGRPRVTSAGYLLCGAGGASYLAFQPTWVRAGAYLFFGIVALNAIAFVVLWLLRHRVRAAEERCVA